jgi:predicted AAA+ superfamily ATPase
MLQREISEKLISWKKQEEKKALCIIGARQIGKTTIILSQTGSQTGTEFSGFFVEKSRKTPSLFGLFFPHEGL